MSVRSLWTVDHLQGEHLSRIEPKRLRPMGASLRRRRASLHIEELAPWVLETQAPRPRRQSLQIKGPAPSTEGRVSTPYCAHLRKPRDPSLRPKRRISPTQETRLSDPKGASFQPKRRIPPTQEAHLSNPRGASLQPKGRVPPAQETHPSSSRDP